MPVVNGGMSLTKYVARMVKVIVLMIVLLIINSMNLLFEVIGDSMSRLLPIAMRSFPMLMMLTMIACLNEPASITIQSAHRIPVDATINGYTYCVRSLPDDILLYMQRDDNAILSIDLKKGLYQKHIFEEQGPKAMPQIRGFTLLKEGILINSLNGPKVYLLDRNLQYIKTIDFGTYEGVEYENTAFTSRVNKEIYEVEGTFIFPKSLHNKGRIIDEKLLDNHVFMTRVDTAARTIVALEGFEYPKSYLLGGSYSPIFTTLRNGNYIIVSPVYGHEIAVYNITDKNTSVLNLQSDYLSTISNHDKFETPIEKRVRSGAYVNMYYDATRNVYYRIVKHENHEKDMSINFDAMHYKNTFSIMIIDEEFNVIDEFVIDDWHSPKYVMENMFMSKEGLKISMNNPFSESYSEDYIEFGLLKYEAH